MQVPTHICWALAAIDKPGGLADENVHEGGEGRARVLQVPGQPARRPGMSTPACLSQSMVGVVGASMKDRLRATAEETMWRLLRRGAGSWGLLGRGGVNRPRG